MQEDILKVSNAGAVRLLQLMNNAKEKMSFGSIPKIERQLLEELIGDLKMILEDHNGYTIELDQDKKTPLGSVQICLP